MARTPERRCIGCGRRGPQSEFVRLCTVERARSTDGGQARVVVPGRGVRGRGAYLCTRQACLDRALQRRAFQRAFRATVEVDEERIREAILAAGAGK